MLIALIIGLLILSVAGGVVVNPWLFAFLLVVLLLVFYPRRPGGPPAGPAI